MTALDTNVIVRFLVKDDPKQARIAYMRLKKAEKNRERLFIPLVVVLEVIWVLDSAYELSRQDILKAIADLRQISILEFEADGVLEQLLSSGNKNKTDLDDMLIAHSAQNLGCETTLTFDKKAARFPLFSLLR